MTFIFSSVIDFPHVAENILIFFVWIFSFAVEDDCMHSIFSIVALFNSICSHSWCDYIRDLWVALRQICCKIHFLPSVLFFHLYSGKSEIASNAFSLYKINHTVCINTFFTLWSLVNGHRMALYFVFFKIEWLTVLVHIF